MIWFAFAVVVLFQIDTHRRMSRLERSLGGVIQREASRYGIRPGDAARLS